MSTFFRSIIIYMLTTATVYKTGTNFQLFSLELYRICILLVSSNVQFTLSRELQTGLVVWNRLIVQDPVTIHIPSIKTRRFSIKNVTLLVVSRTRNLSTTSLNYLEMNAFSMLRVYYNFISRMSLSQLDC